MPLLFISALAASIAELEELAAALAANQAATLVFLVTNRAAEELALHRVADLKRAHFYLVSRAAPKSPLPVPQAAEAEATRATIASANLIDCL